MNSSKLPYGMHWFRRDLRIVSNPALTRNLEQQNGRVVGIFFFDSKFLARPDFSNNRFAFFLETLAALRQEMGALGGDLLILNNSPAKGFVEVFEKLRQLKEPLPQLLSFNRDYEPFARDRDAQVEQLLLQGYGMKTLTTPDHLLIEPQEVHRPDGGTYQVFTPFSKTWLSRFALPFSQNRLLEAKAGLQSLHQRKQGQRPDRIFFLKWRGLLGASKPFSEPFTDKLAAFSEANRKKVTVPIPEAGSLAAYLQLLSFKKRLVRYAEGRDYPAQGNTSNLSIYLKNGSLTTAQIFAELGDQPQAKPYLRQLIWREFYYHILFHYPRVETEAFREKYRSLKWQNRSDWFEAWKQGQTGYPIVDAGMRQLLTTGLMHNRVRMIVASFLTKDLLIDWRWGEQWFMQNLLDGDLAANNGGWQWAASTGCDPQPYFRIFNPELQSRRFDPKGTYIRRYVPELRECSDREIHTPPNHKRTHSYPSPIVDHAQQKLAALRLFR